MTGSPGFSRCSRWWVYGQSESNIYNYIRLNCRGMHGLPVKRLKAVNNNSLKLLSLLTVNSANNKLACLLRPPLRICCTDERNPLIRLNQNLARHTDILLLKEETGAQLCLSLCLFPRGEYAVAEFKRWVMFTCSGLCHLHSFCSFLLIKPWNHCCPSKGHEGFLCAFFLPLWEGISSRSATSLKTNKFWYSICNILEEWGCYKIRDICS